MNNYPSPAQDASGFTAGFLLGLIVGGAGGYLLSTDRGRALLSQLKEGAGDKLAELTENPALAGKLSELENTMAQARASLKSSTSSAQARLHRAAVEVARVTESPPKKKKKTFFRRGTPLK